MGGVAQRRGSRERHDPAADPPVRGAHGSERPSGNQHDAGVEVMIAFVRDASGNQANGEIDWREVELGLPVIRIARPELAQVAKQRAQGKRAARREALGKQNRQQHGRQPKHRRQHGACRARRLEAEKEPADKRDEEHAAKIGHAREVAVPQFEAQPEIARPLGEDGKDGGRAVVARTPAPEGERRGKCEGRHAHSSPLIAAWRARRRSRRGGAAPLPKGSAAVHVHARTPAVPAALRRCGAAHPRRPCALRPRRAVP